MSKKTVGIQVRATFVINVPEDELVFYLNEDDHADRDESIWEYLTAWDCRSIEGYKLSTEERVKSCAVTYNDLEVLGVEY
jgi:hypothetical protein